MARRTVEAGRTSGVWRPVTPDDDVDLPDKQPSAIYIGTSGDLVALDETGEQVTFANAPAGYHPIRPVRILSTGTTASDIVALY